MVDDEAGEIIKNLFKLLHNRYKNNLQNLMKGSEFLFDYVHLLYYKCHKINPNCVGLYINSLDWIIYKKGAINPINKKDDKCFQHAVRVVLNHEKIGKHSNEQQKLILL